MTEGDRPPPEASTDSPHVGRYYGPFGSEPWLPLDQSEERQGPPLAEGLPAAAPAAPIQSRRSPGLVIAAAGLTALLVGGGAGYGGALLAGRSTNQELAAPPAGTQTSAVPPTPGASTTDGGNPGPSSGGPSGEAGRSTVEVANAVLPSTVMIKAGNGTGSGFAFDSSGHIMTNDHVVAAADGERLRVVLSNGRRLNATVLGRSKSYDLAVIRVNAPGLKPLHIGDSEAVQVGEPVLAVGSPLGLPGTVTSGIVSARNRPVAVRETESADAASAYIDAIQTDAPINPGNSGGPLIDSRARVIGVNSAILTLASSRGQVGSIGLGFAIPINQAVEIGQLLIKNGKATYPVIGAKVEEAGGDDGVVLTSVDGASPAADAGLREGDVITKIDGKRVTTVEELIVTIRTHRPREAVVLDYERGDARRQARIVLGSEEG
jgi:putative serine protease PepD